MAGPRRGDIGPQEIHQVFARELPSRFDGEADQEGEMLARAEADLLAGLSEEQGSAQRQ